MANVCSNTLVITVEDDQYAQELDELYDKIERADPVLIQKIPFLKRSTHEYGLLEYAQESDGDIQLVFDSLWQPPEKDLCDFSKLYPHCLMRLNSEEAGRKIYLEQTYKGGHKTCETKLTEKQYLCAYYDGMEKTLRNIERYSSKRAVQYILHTFPNSLREYFYEMEAALERVRDEDLPLLINHSWYDDTTLKDLYKDRIYKLYHRRLYE